MFKNMFKGTEHATRESSQCLLYSGLTYEGYCGSIFILFLQCVRPCIKTNPFVVNLMQLKIQINFYDEQDSLLGLFLSSETKTNNETSPSNKKAFVRLYNWIIFKSFYCLLKSCLKVCHCSMVRVFIILFKTICKLENLSFGNYKTHAIEFLQNS